MNEARAQEFNQNQPVLRLIGLQRAFRQGTREINVLAGASVDVWAGQCVALVGPSGSGKSTVASLLLRFYDPRSGEIRIDGVDIRRYSRESLRREIGVVLQDSILFGASIRENIAYGKPDASPE